jgi:nitroreductase
MATSTSTAVDLRCHAEDIVRAASLAPSQHNTQPWVFRVGPAAVEVYADRSRRLPVADPDDRQLFIGVGAAVFGVRLALARLGVRSVVRLARDSARPDLAAVVVPAGAAAGLGEDDRLYAELDRRRTVRGPFSDDPVPVPLQVRLTNLARQEGAVLAWAVRDRPRRRLAALVLDAERAQQSDPDFRAEVDRWVGASVVERGSGIPLASVGTVAIAGKVAEFKQRDFTIGRGGAAPSAGRPEAYPGVAALCTMTDQRADWLRAGQAMHRVLLAASADGYAASFLNQPLEIFRLRSQVRRELRLRGYPQVVLRLGRPRDPLPPPTPAGR